MQRKGKECDRTVLIPALPRRVSESMVTFDEDSNAKAKAAEARLWYVAATRARNDLVIVDPYDPAFANNLAYNLPPKPNAEEMLL